MEAVPIPPPSGRPTTISVVAKHAGVGTGTVSRVLNNASGVADETRQRVLEVIRELNYQPSQVARNLSLGRTSTIAAVVPFFTHPSAVERLRGVVRVLTAKRYNIALHDVELREQRDEQFRLLSAPGVADAVLIVSLPLDEDEVDRFQASGIPLVLLDVSHTGAASIVTDNVAGGALATGHLLELGHRRIAFIGDSPANPYGFTSSVDRRTGYQAALAEWGVAPDPMYLREGAHDADVAGRMTEELLRQDAPPTAIFVASDSQALGVLEAARRMNVRVPQQLSVIGFDDIEVARHVGLTTVRQPLEASGARAAELLLAALDGAAVHDTVERLELSLSIRQTTAPAVSRPQP